MYVAIIDVELKENMEDSFKNWISTTNKTLSKFPGFINRRLVKSENGKYRLVVEFADKESHHKLHQTSEHHEIHGQLMNYLSKMPVPMFYNVIAE